MGYSYDNDNIFARILRGEIPNTTVAETEHTLAFRDIRPQAPDHVLVVPKGPYVDFAHFTSAASPAEIADFISTVGKVVEDLGVSPGTGGGGFRLISNAGTDAIQEVPHMHVHIVAGRPLGPILAS